MKNLLLFGTIAVRGGREMAGIKARLQPPYENIQCDTLSTVPR